MQGYCRGCCRSCQCTIRTCFLWCCINFCCCVISGGCAIIDITLTARQLLSGRALLAGILHGSELHHVAQKQWYVRRLNVLHVPLELRQHGSAVQWRLALQCAPVVVWAFLLWRLPRV